jgi:hypothetical protein
MRQRRDQTPPVDLAVVDLIALRLAVAGIVMVPVVMRLDARPARLDGLRRHRDRRGRRLHAHRRPEHRATFTDGLRRAGLPE